MSDSQIINQTGVLTKESPSPRTQMQWPNLIVKLEIERTVREFRETQGDCGDCAICGSVTEFVAAAWFTPSEKYRVDVFRVCEKCSSDLSQEELDASLSRLSEKAFGFEVDRTSHGAPR